MQTACYKEIFTKKGKRNAISDVFANVNRISMF